MKRAYVVVGPESSGNRMLASLLIGAGCCGGTAFDHPLMFDVPTGEDPVVLIRSFPHGDGWPDLAEIYRTLRSRGYMVRVLVTVRDPHCVIESQVERRHHPPELAWSNYQQSYRRIFEQLLTVNAWYALVPYATLRRGEAQRNLLATLGLPAVEVEVRDENAKHYA